MDNGNLSKKFKTEMPDEMLTKYCKQSNIYKLEDLRVLKRSTDLLNNVKIGQGQLQFIIKQFLF